MEALSSIGLNSSIVVQLGLFLVCYLFISNLIFKPYIRAYEERVKRTEGAEGDLQSLVATIKNLEAQYENRAREINYRIREIFDEARGQGHAEQDRVLELMRQELMTRAEQHRRKLEDQKLEAQRSLEKEIPQIGKLIAEKVTEARA